MTRNTLQFVHSARPPDADLRVFDSLTREFLGTEFTFRVIGSSHSVSAPALDFHELSSCEAVDVDGATTIRLDAPPSDGVATRRLVHETEALRCETVVERQPLAAFPGVDAADLAYEFEAEAVTTIDVGTDAYETYHTYPEFDLALFTRTVFTTVPPDATPVDDGLVTSTD